MACIGRISEDLRMACGAPPPSFNRIQGAMAFNAEDVASYTVTSGGIAEITMKPTTKGYPLETANNALSVTVALKSQDITPGAYDVSIAFKQFGTIHSGVMASLRQPMGGANYMATGALIFAVDYGGGVYRIFGLGAPLTCLEYGTDSTENGFVAITYGVEDWQVGTTIHGLTKAGYDALVTPAPPTP